MKSHFLLLFFSLNLLNGLSQSTPKLQIQIGHSNPIRDIAVSPSGRNLFSFDNEGIIKIWDVKSGKIVRTISSKGGIVKEIIPHFKKRVFAVCYAKTIRIKGFASKNYPTIKFKNNIRSFDFGPENLFVITTTKNIYIKDYKLDSTIYKLKTYNKKAFFLNDSTIIYNSGKDLKTWNFISGVEEKISGINEDIFYNEDDIPILKVDSRINRILLIQQKKWFVYDLDFNLISTSKKLNENESFEKVEFMGPKHIYYIINKEKKGAESFILNLENKIITSFKPEFNEEVGHTIVAWNKYYPNALFYKKSSKKLILVDLKTYDVLQEFKGIEGNKAIYNVEYAASINNLYYKQNGAITEFDLNKGKVNREFKGTLFQVVDLDNKKYLFSINHYHPDRLTFCNLEDEAPSTDINFKAPLEDVIESFYYYSESGKLILVSENSKFYHLTYNKETRQLEPQFIDFELKKDEKLIDLSSKSNVITKSSNQSIYKTLIKYDNSNVEREVYTGKIDIAKFIPGTEDVIIASPDSILRLNTTTKEVVWKRKNSKNWRYWTSISFSNDTTLFALGGDDGYIRIYNLIDGSIKQKGNRVHYDEIKKMIFLKDDKRLLTVGLDGKITIINAEGDYEKIVTIFPFSRKERVAGKRQSSFLIYTPKNYYYAQNIDPNMFHYTLDYKVYSFDQFDLKYNRPDIVFEQMNGDSYYSRSFYGAYKKRLERLGYDERLFDKDFVFPELKITNRKSLPTHTDEKHLEIKVTATDESKLKYINLWVNGIPIYGIKGKEIPDKESKKRSGVLDVELTKGLNIIQVAITNESGIESFKETVEITYAGQEEKPNLYFIGLGIKEYQDSTMNLKYSDKDIRDLTALLTVKTDVYNKIYIDTFLNSSVTKNCLDGIKAKLLKSKPNDMIFVYYSGHGLVDENDNFNYYLSTHDIDFKNPNEKGLRYDILEAMLDSIPARNKTILLDACHSGELDHPVVKDNENVEAKSFGAKGNLFKKMVNNDDAKSFELMKELFADIRRNTGTNVIASSSGLYFSFEDEKYKNGVFTYCLKKGLSGRADLNKDNEITISELKEYLVFSVSELTNGDQTPTTRIENTLNDFRIW